MLNHYQDESTDMKIQSLIELDFLQDTFQFADDSFSDFLAIIGMFRKNNSSF